MKFKPNSKTLLALSLLKELKDRADDKNIVLHLSATWGITALNGEIFKNTKDVDFNVKGCDIVETRKIIKAVGFDFDRVHSEYKYEMYSHPKYKIGLDIGHSDEEKCIFKEMDFDRPFKGYISGYRFDVSDPRFILKNQLRLIREGVKKLDSQKIQYIEILLKSIRESEEDLGLEYIEGLSVLSW